MTLKIDVKIDYKEAEVAGYGLVKVRPMGAGEQLELTSLQNELESYQEPLKELQEAEDNEDTRKQIHELSLKMATTVQKVQDLIAGCFSSDDPKVAERLVKELPVNELSRISAEILKNA